jgi:hypothetical protein
VRRVTGNPAAKYRALVLVLAFCGLRWGEVAGLKVGRVNLLKRRLTVAETLSEVNGDLVWGTPKNHAARSVPIPSFLVDMLAEVAAGKAPDDLVFTTWRGKPLRNLNFRRDVFDKAAEDVGLAGLTPHELRHTAASLMVSAGANVKAVQRALGHASAAMTLDVYSGLFDDDLDGVAARLDLSSSGTRLTDEFRYLRDMINIVLRVGWSRAAASGAGLRGRGQGSAVRPTARRRGLDADTGRRIMGLAGPPVRGGERAMLFGPVVPARMHPHDAAVTGKLDGVGDNTDLDLSAAPAVTDPIVGAGKRHVAGRIDHPVHHHPVGGPAGPAAALPQFGFAGATLGLAALDMLGDQHLTMEDPHQMIGGDRLDRLPGQHDRHPIFKPAQRDQAVLVHPALHPGQPHNRGGRLHHRRLGCQ